MLNTKSRWFHAFCLIVLTCVPFASAADEKPAKPYPFENKIKEFEAADAKKMPAPDSVLFIGSSSIVLWKTLAEDFPGIPVINRGFGGSQIAHSTHFADRIVIPYKPKTIVFYAGDNDINGGKTPDRVFSDYKAFVEKVHSKLPNTHIHYISIKPSIARWKLIDKIREANRLIKEYSESDKTLSYIDVFTPMLGKDGQPRPELLGPDGLHMTRKGYELWRDIVKPVISEKETTAN